MSDQVVVSRGKLVAVADAIRAKNATTDGLTLDDMAGAIESIEGGGGISFDDIASRALVGDVSVTVSNVLAYSFYGCTGITSFSAPNATTIGGYTCYSASGLNGALNLPACTNIGTYAFYQCTDITELIAPNVTTMGDYAFARCKNIKALSFPELTAIPVGAFAGAASYKMLATSIELPKCKTIGNSSMGYFDKITRLVLPECTSIGNSACTNWPTLAFVDLGKCKSISNYGLRNNGKLATLILRSETMCALSNYALNSTAIWNGNGYVYVPRDLIPSYQVATNWKTIYAKNANVFRAIEDYPEVVGG